MENIDKIGKSLGIFNIQNGLFIEDDNEYELCIMDRNLAHLLYHTGHYHTPNVLSFIPLDKQKAIVRIDRRYPLSIEVPDFSDALKEAEKGNILFPYMDDIILALKSMNSCLEADKQIDVNKVEPHMFSMNKNGKIYFNKFDEYSISRDLTSDNEEQYSPLSEYVVESETSYDSPRISFEELQSKINNLDLEKAGIIFKISLDEWDENTVYLDSFERNINTPKGSGLYFLKKICSILDKEGYAINLEVQDTRGLIEMYDSAGFIIKGEEEVSSEVRKIYMARVYNQETYINHLANNIENQRKIEKNRMPEI